jgi:DNA-directed RNA polymerase subunit F
MKVVSSRPLSLAEVREIFEEKEKKEQLSYEQQQVLEHAKKFATESAKEAKEIIKKLEANKKLNEETIVKIVDIKPKKAETLKLILLKDKIELTDEEINEILKLFKS